MKQMARFSFAAAAVVCVAPSAFAQEQGRVISTTPVIQQVAVPRQVCTNEQVQSTTQQKSGAGAIMGGIAGGAMGNAVGDGSGRAAATMIGIVGGAILGNRIEGGRPETQTQNVQRCTTQTFYENKPVAYNVVYEFNGKQYQVQLPQDPGPFVSLQVTPVGGQAAPLPAPTPAPVIVRPVTQAPVYTQPVIVESYTTYVQPAPVYVHPAPVVYAPAPVFVRPAPVVRYVHPRPVVVQGHRSPYGHVHGYGHGHGHGHSRGVVSIGYSGYIR
jgi:uncharacterized protein YcfJ